MTLHGSEPEAVPVADPAALRDTHWSPIRAGSAEPLLPPDELQPAEGERSWMGGRTMPYGPRFDSCQHLVADVVPAPPPTLPGETSGAAA